MIAAPPHPQFVSFRCTKLIPIRCAVSYAKFIAIQCAKLIAQFVSFRCTNLIAIRAPSSSPSSSPSDAPSSSPSDADVPSLLPSSSPSDAPSLLSTPTQLQPQDGNQSLFSRGCQWPSVQSSRCSPSSTSQGSAASRTLATSLIFSLHQSPDSPVRPTSIYEQLPCLCPVVYKPGVFRHQFYHRKLIIDSTKSANLLI